MIPASKTERRNPLVGRGPIVDRARLGLGRVAEQFGTVTHKNLTHVKVKTDDGMDLTMTFEPGNYIFSRVYNLVVQARLPIAPELPTRMVLSHKTDNGPRFLAKSASSTSVSSETSAALKQFNDYLRPHFDSVDLLRSEILVRGDVATITVTPIGGAYVWVFIPPIFHVTAFPEGEPGRIRKLISAIGRWRP